MKLLLIILAAMAMALPAEASCPTNRSSTIRAQFQRSHPCPVNGLKRGACPGYVVDHIVALCRGGPDKVSNMQWQTLAESKAKDRVECKP